MELIVIESRLVSDLRDVPIFNRVAWPLLAEGAPVGFPTRSHPQGLQPVGAYAIRLPYPPSSNRYWRNFRGRMVKSTDARRYDAEVKALARLAGVFDPIEGPVSVRVDIYRARAMGDLDNRAKVLLDALQGIAYVDDKQIVEIHSRRFDDPGDPRAEVLIVDLGDASR